MNFPLTILGLTLSVSTHPLPASIAETQAQLPEQSETINRRVALMGTSLTVEVEHQDRESALTASESAIHAIEIVESRLSTWRETSELSKFNRAPVGSEVSLSPELFRELSRSSELWKLTEGAFDPAVGALVEAWGFRSNGRTPSSTEKQASLLPNGFGSLQWSSSLSADSSPSDHNTLIRHHANLRIDAGGFGKGAALDQALDALRAAGATSAQLNFGGQIATFGNAIETSIADPRDRQAEVVSLTIKDCSVATSGNSERAIEVNGVRFGHLLDPRSGEPVPDFGTVTVLAPDAFTADALATGFYVMGPERALQVAEQIEAVELLILDNRESELRILTTSGLRDAIKILNPDSSHSSVSVECPTSSSKALPRSTM